MVKNSGHPLSEWINKNKVMLSKVCDDTGYSISYLSPVVNYKCDAPSMAFRKSIEMYTNGEVKADDPRWNV